MLHTVNSPDIQRKQHKNVKGAKMEEIKRDCENCKHYVCGDDGYYSCEKWNCEFESKEENTDEDSN